MNVAGDQEFSRAYGNGSRGGMQARLANIGRAVRIAQHSFPQPFKLALANVLKVRAFRPRRGGLVEIHGDTVALPDFAAHAPRKGDAFFHGDIIDGNEWK